MNKKLSAVVIDGNSLMYRMFYATANLAEYAIEHQMVPVNAVKLMIETGLKLQQSHYDYCLVAFDHDKKTLRHDLFADYKSGRKKMPEALVTQIPLIKEALNLLGFNIMSKEGIEADDLIGSFAKLMNNDNIHVDIYTSDKDMLQLVNNLTYVHLIKTGLSNVIIHTVDNFSNLTKGLQPQQIPDYKAIVGDKSDNLVGVKGIGEKTGLDLIKKYQNFDQIYLHLDELSPSIKDKFLSSKEVAELCKHLATIDDKIFNKDYVANDFLNHPIQIQSLKEFLKKYQINGLDKYFNQVNFSEQITLLEED